MMREVISRDAAKERGLPQFFTGAPCRNGHVTGRFSASGSCVECERERKFKRNLTHRDTNKPPAPIARRQEELAQEIRRQGMTHREFCESLGWCPLTISRWRTRARGNRTPWVDELVTAWKALGYSLIAAPLDGATVKPGKSPKLPKAPLECHPIVARMFFEQEQLGWSRKHLAEVAGVAENTLGRMASGESRGKFEIVEACYNAMGMTLTPRPYAKKEKKRVA